MVLRLLSMLMIILNIQITSKLQYVLDAQEQRAYLLKTVGLLEIVQTVVYVAVLLPVKNDPHSLLKTFQEKVEVRLKYLVCPLLCRLTLLNDFNEVEPLELFEQFI
jgi:hypothetical protein